MGDNPIPRETKTPETWDEGDSRDFIRFGDYFVPERELQDKIVCGLIPDRPDGAVIVELCCGDGHLTRAMLARHQSCRVIALDGSPEMLKRAAAVLKEYGGRVDLREFALSDAPWHTLPAPPHAVSPRWRFITWMQNRNKSCFARSSGRWKPAASLWWRTWFCPKANRGPRSPRGSGTTWFAKNPWAGAGTFPRLNGFKCRDGIFSPTRAPIPSIGLHRLSAS